ncbi:hypothetical protein CCP3SC15_580027 [Gammaproteobacteria bacterium]
MSKQHVRETHLHDPVEWCAEAGCVAVYPAADYDALAAQSERWEWEFRRAVKNCERYEERLSDAEARLTEAERLLRESKQAWRYIVGGQSVIDRIDAFLRPAEQETPVT